MKGLFSSIFVFIVFSAFAQEDLDAIYQNKLNQSKKYYSSYKFDSAKWVALEVVEIASNNKDSVWLAEGYNLLGSIFYVSNQIDTAYNYYSKASMLFEALDDPGRYRTQANLGMILARLERYGEAAIYQKEALAGFRMNRNELQELYTLLNLGLTYREIDEDTSFFYMFEAFHHAVELKNEPLIAQTASSLANRFLNTSQFDSAIHYGEIVLENKTSSKFATAQTKYVLAKAYYEKGNFQRAEKFNLESFEITEMLNQPAIAGGNYELFYRLAENQDNYKKALDFYKKWDFIEDSIVSAKKTKELDELLVKYETSQKEQEIASLSQENTIKDLQLSQQRIMLFVGSGFLILVILIALLLHKQRKDSAEKKRLKLEQHLLRSQMNPHFIFNALTSIQNLILGDKNEEAVGYLSRFGELTRDVLESSRREWISLDKELAMLKNYVKLESAGFEEELKLAIHCDELEIDQVMVPPMILQPFVENSIKHGFTGRESGEIRVWLTQSDNQLNVQIEDNGQGLNEEQKEERESLALTIVKERLKRHRLDEKALPKVRNSYREDQTLLGVVAYFRLPLVHAY